MRQVFCFFVSIAFSAQGQISTVFERYFQALDQDQIGAASTASTNGQLYERRQDWQAALRQYQSAAEFLKSADTAAGCLLRSSANLDVARMLDKLNRRFSTDYIAAVKAATESSQRALELEDKATLQAPPSVQPRFATLRSSTYGNLGLARSMSGDLIGARSQWQMGLSLEPHSSTLRDSIDRLTTIERQKPPASRPGTLRSPTDEQSREWAIGVGTALAFREYPVAASVIGATLVLINHMYSQATPGR